jgi:hypothetical protein
MRKYILFYKRGIEREEREREIGERERERERERDCSGIPRMPLGHHVQRWKKSAGFTRTVGPMLVAAESFARQAKNTHFAHLSAD